MEEELPTLDGEASMSSVRLRVRFLMVVGDGENPGLDEVSESSLLAICSLDSLQVETRRGGSASPSRGEARRSSSERA